MKNTENTTPRKRPTAAKLAGGNDIIVEIANHDNDPVKQFMNKNLARGLIVEMTLMDGSKVLAQVMEIGRSRGASGSTSATMMTSTKELMVLNWRLGIYGITASKVAATIETGWENLGGLDGDSSKVLLVARKGQNQAIKSLRTPSLWEVAGLMTM